MEAFVALLHKLSQYLAVVILEIYGHLYSNVHLSGWGSKHTEYKFRVLPITWI